VDARHFDTLTRGLTEAGTRRGLLALLAALPILGGLLALFDPDEAEAKGRRKRRKKSHKHGKGNGRHRTGKRKCKPQAKTRTCSGKCGSVKNNCGKKIDCGSCDCDPPCGDCLICQAGPTTPGACVPDPAQNGDPCDDGERCTTGSTCTDGVCGGGSPVVCPATDCQIPGVCNPDSGTCTSPANEPAGTACASQPCGECNGGGVCVANAACSGATPVCDEGICAPCSADPEGCPGSTCCDADTGACVATCPAGAPICGADNFCTCASHADCGTNHLCVDGACHACDVVDGENLATAIGAAGNGDTLYVCPGTFAGDIAITANITLIGAGDGPDGAIIQGPNNQDVLTIQAGTEEQPVTLRNLRLQNGFTGIGVGQDRHLTMTGCAVRENVGNGGIYNNGGTLRLTGCTLADNDAPASGQGGGLRNDRGPATLTDCQVQDNSADEEGGGIYNVNPGGVLTLRNTRVSGNSLVVGSSGSGIRNFNNGTVSLEDGSVVCANTPITDQCLGFTDPGGACQATCPPVP
jgi:hypothetical protein